MRRRDAPVLALLLMTAMSGSALALKPLPGCAKQCGMDTDGVMSCQTVCSIPGGLTPGQAEAICRGICTEATCKPNPGKQISAQCLHTCEEHCVRGLLK